MDDKFESKIGWSLVPGASAGNSHISRIIRLDKGTETGVMATMHAYVRRNHSDIDDPLDTILYGPSTSNQVTRFE